MVLTKGKLAILTVISLLEILLFGGLQYGWISLLYILKEEGVYKELCNATNINSTEDPKNASTDQCLAQDERLNLLFSIGLAVFNIMTLLCGQLYTRFITATRMIRTGSIFVLVAGLICFGVTSPDIPWLLLPGLICVGTGGVSFVISNMQVAVLLPKGSSLYIGLLNGCFDSSVVVQMAGKALYENGFNLPHIYAAVATLCFCISGLCTVLHPCHKPEDTVGIKNNSKTRYTEGRTNSAFEKEIKSSEAVPPKTKATANKVPSVSDDATPISVRTIACSRLYIFQVLWFSIMLLRFYFFIGSINSSLVLTLENDKQVSYFTDVMTYIMLGGMVSSFIAGQVLEEQKRWFTGTMKTVIPLTVTSCLAIILSSLSIVTSKTVLYTEYVVLTFLRSFIFSVNMDFIVFSFPQRFISLLFGLVCFVCGILTLTQYFLFTWMTQYEDAMKHVNIFLLCLSVLSLLHPLFIYLDRKSISKEEEMKVNSRHVLSTKM